MRENTFENFVIGTCNEEAFYALESAAKGEFAAPEYRGEHIIFLCGGVGAGKSHLLRACETFINEQYLHVRACYRTADEFAEDLLEELRRGGSWQSFLRHYDEFGVLLLDDIHILEGREATQELLALILERFWNARKMAVLAGDAFPKFLYGLDVRIVNLQAADYGVRQEILRRTAAALGIDLETDGQRKNMEEAIDMLSAQGTEDLRTMIGNFKQMAARLQLLGEAMKQEQENE